eukprot:m.107042 g.107042  ORF g.107042 m.107042 type:complete len:441 (-) comp12729_c0_seq1:1568-2890(-)
MLTRVWRPVASVLRAGPSVVQARFSGGYDGFDAKKTKRAGTSPIPSELFDSKSGELHSVERVLDTYVPEAERTAVKKILFGLNQGKLVEKLEIPSAAAKIAKDNDFDITLSKFEAGPDGRPPRVVRFGVTQNCIIEPTDAPIEQQYKALEAKHEKFVEGAAAAGCNVICFQEAWTMPFAFCTREKLPWSEFAECAQTGPSVKACQRWALKHNMVIVSPILERDIAHGGTLWNTAVVIGNNGNIIGKHRKNHIPRVGDFNESTYYMEGNTGWPVFETQFGKLAINICYGRHHPLNWMTFGLNGAEIVFNPSATVGALSEPMWPIEARCAAIANNYFVAGNNRVGTETFPNEFTSGNKQPAHKDFGHFYGSSYIAGPDSSRAEGLSRVRDGIAIAEADLNLCRQVKDTWVFQMTARHADYADNLADYVSMDFEPQVIRDPTL